MNILILTGENLSKKDGKYLYYYLKKNKHETIAVVSSIQMAINKLKKVEFELIITDTCLPFYSPIMSPNHVVTNEDKAGFTMGIHIAKWIKKNYKKIKIWVYSPPTLTKDIKISDGIDSVYCKIEWKMLLYALRKDYEKD